MIRLSARRSNRASSGGFAAAIECWRKASEGAAEAPSDSAPALYCRPMTPNHVKQRLRAGKACFGSLLNFGDPLVAELMASAGFDWLLADTEHGPIDLATLATMFATITRYPCAPFVRVHALSEESVKRVLDAGGSRRAERLVRGGGPGAVTRAAAPGVRGRDAEGPRRSAAPRRRRGHPLPQARDGEPPDPRGVDARRDGERPAVPPRGGESRTRRRQDRRVTAPRLGIVLSPFASEPVADFIAVAREAETRGYHTA